jgi:hypothetical protein
VGTISRNTMFGICAPRNLFLYRPRRRYQEHHRWIYVGCTHLQWTSPGTVLLPPFYLARPGWSAWPTIGHLRQHARAQARTARVISPLAPNEVSRGSPGFRNFVVMLILTEAKCAPVAHQACVVQYVWKRGFNANHTTSNLVCNERALPVARHVALSCLCDENHSRTKLIMSSLS